MKYFYHQRILPRPDYHKITVDTYLEKFFLLRYSIGDKSIKKRDSNIAKHFVASQFYDGLSVNLLSVFHKQDAAFKVLGTAQEQQHNCWSTGDSPICMQDSMLKYLRCRGFVGIRIKDLYKAKIDKWEIKINGVSQRNDNVYFKLEHAPTKCNFWHFNIHIEAINSIDNSKYLLRDIEGYSKNQLSKVAGELLHQIEDYVKRRCKMKAYPLPKSYYKSKKGI